ncbi:MAG: prefoldin subunit alpha [Thermoplasmata archaeon]
MSGAPETITEERLQEELMRLEAYRNQLSAILQQHEILSASRVEHLRARESLEGVDRSTPGTEFLLPLGGEAFVRGSVVKDSPVLLGIGSGIVVEMDRAKVLEVLAERATKIEQAVRDLEGQGGALEERIQQLSRRLESVSRGPAPAGHVGRD